MSKPIFFPDNPVWLWFEFYKLALKDPNLISLCAKSAAYYSRWGDVQHEWFHHWWPSHSHLFESWKVVEITKVDSDDPAIALSVPRSQSLNKSIEQIEAILKSRLSEHVSRVEPKKYRLTEGRKLRLGPIQRAYITYRWVYLDRQFPNASQDAAFLKRIQYLYRHHPNFLRQVRLPPQLATSETDASIDSTVKLLRRDIMYAKKLMLAAALGDFPGKKN